MKKQYRRKRCEVCGQSYQVVYFPKHVCNPKERDEVKEMKFITIRIPLLDTGDTVEQKRRKMLEETDELAAEFSVAPVIIEKALEEFFDTGQVITGYLLANEKDVTIEAAISWINLQMQMANARHNDKMQQRAEERGWKVI